MPRWIYACCRNAIGELPARRLLDGISDRDPRASAGVDYATLSEDYPVGAVDLEAVERLAASARDGGWEVVYGEPPSRPLRVHRWAGDDARRRARELVSASEPRPALPADQVKEVIGVQLWSHQLEDMGLVFAYEIVRYLGQLGDATVLNDRGDWQEIEEGAFRPTGARHPLPPWRPPQQEEERLHELDALSPAEIERRAREGVDRFSTRQEDAAVLLASIHRRMPDSTPDLPIELDALIEDAMRGGCRSGYSAPPSVMAWVHRLVAALPDTRREALMAPPDGVRWSFLLDAPTERAMERAVEEAAAWPRIVNMSDRHAALTALSRLPATAEPLCRALASRRPQRLMLLAALASLSRAEALDTLVHHLADPLDRVRAVARWGLLLLGPAAARDALERCLESRGRRQREEAREVLRWFEEGREVVPRAAETGWCAGCGISLETDRHHCPLCVARLQPLPEDPWRALSAPKCPVDLTQR